MDEDVGQLAKRAALGDAGAFGRLIRRFEKSALAVAYAIAGDGHASGDIVQEAFCRGWENIGGLREPSQFGAWICQIVRRVAIDQKRRKKSTGEIEIAPDFKGEASSDHTDRREISESIDAALADLDPISRSAIVLCYYENLSSREIGELLELSEAAVNMRLSRAREELRKKLASTVEPSNGRPR